LNIEHWLWHVARYRVDTCTFKFFFKKNSKKSRSDTWHTTGLTHGHLKKLKKYKENKIKNQKTTKW